MAPSANNAPTSPSAQDTRQLNPADPMTPLPAPETSRSPLTPLTPLTPDQPQPHGIPGSQDSTFSLGDDDFSHLSPEFFAGMDPFGPDVGNLPVGGANHTWGDAEAREVVEDPYADDDEDMVISSPSQPGADADVAHNSDQDAIGSSDVDVDELMSSPIHPSAPHPSVPQGIPKAPLRDTDPARPISALGLDYSSSSEEDDDSTEAHEQIGGGREATPPSNPPSTRLRTQLVTTPNADASAKAAVERRRLLADEDETPPIATLPSSTPGASTSTAPPIATLQAVQKSKRKQAATTVLKTGAGLKIGLPKGVPRQAPPPPSAGAPSSPGNAGRATRAPPPPPAGTMGPPPKPTRIKTGAVLPFNSPVQQNPFQTGPPYAATPPHASTTHAPAHASTTRAPTRAPARAPVRASLNAAPPVDTAPTRASLNAAPPVDTAPSLDLASASSSHAPHTAAHDSGENILTPDAFVHGTFFQYMAQAEFKSHPVPPPPPGWANAHRKQSADGEDMGGGDEGGGDVGGEDMGGGDEGEGDASGEDAGGADESDDSDFAAAPRGRPSTELLDKLKIHFAAFNDTLAAAASDTGLTESRVLNAFLKDRDAGETERSWNYWNIYQAYANGDSHRLEEYIRINPTFSPNGADVPFLKHQMSDAFKAFKVAFPDDKWKTILKAYGVVQNLEKGVTIAARQRHFKRVVKKLEDKLVNLKKQYDYHSFFLLVGGHVNEDTELGHLGATGEGMQFLPGIFGVESHELLGITKTLAYLSANEVDKLELAKGSVKIVNGRLDLPSMSASEPPAPPTKRLRRTIPRPPNAQAGPSRQTVAPPSVRSPSVPLPPRLKLEPLPATNFGHLQGPKKEEAQRQRTDRAKVETNDVQHRLSLASITDLGVDFFRDLPPKNGFGWTRTPAIAKAHGIVMAGYPFAKGIRLPTQFSGQKGATALRQPERNKLNDALDARVIPGQGLRFFKRPYAQNDIVLYTHDYSVSTPPGEPNSPQVLQHWTTSGGEQLPCVDGEGRMFYARFDLDKKVFTRGADIGKTEEMVKGDDDDAEDDDDVHPTRKAKSSKGKKKVTVVDSNSDSDVSPEEEEKTTPPVARITRSKTHMQEGGGPRPPRTAAAASNAPHAPAVSKLPRAPAAAVAPTAAVISNPPRAPAPRPRPRPAGPTAAKAHATAANRRSRSEASDDGSPSPRPHKKPVTRHVSFVDEHPEDEDEDGDDDLLLSQIAARKRKSSRRAPPQEEEEEEPPKKRSKDTSSLPRPASTSTRTKSKEKVKASSSLPPVTASPRQTMSHVEVPLPSRTTVPVSSGARSRTTALLGTQSHSAHASGSHTHASGSQASPRELRSHTAGATRPLLAPPAAPAARDRPRPTMEVRPEEGTLLFKNLTPDEVRAVRDMLSK
ncbi:hypothetical protein C8R44DRAFT_750659 [Mycena epipterygia]|nr:hypothetical protein C8R44DRAFT_750659 [Mycena epipterygia]